MTTFALAMAPWRQCRHTQPSVKCAACYCLGLSVLFVGALYLLVPPKVRNLDREDAQQIKWRIFAVTAVCIIATFKYALLFCDTKDSSEYASDRSALTLMGWSFESRDGVGVLLHACSLYLGPILASLFYVRSAQERMMVGGRDISYMQALYLIQIKPVISPFFHPADESQRWSQIRNLLVAPLAEEIVFRGCMISPLLSSGLKSPAASFIAPLFFGTAHFHHAYLKVKQGNRISLVVLATVFQFTYTTLFGAYAAYAFIRTGSILVIFLSHSFCNCMGLPDLGFLQSRGSRLSPIYPYRSVIMTAYLMGVLAFIYGFQSNVMLLPPPPGRLVESLNESMSYSIAE